MAEKAAKAAQEAACKAESDAHGAWVRPRGRTTAAASELADGRRPLLVIAPGAKVLRRVVAAEAAAASAAAARAVALRKAGMRDEAARALAEGGGEYGIEDD